MMRAGVLIFVIATAASGQSPIEATLSGTIIDAATRQPIAGARVSYDAPVAGAVSFVISDGSGRYAIHINLAEAPRFMDSFPLSVKVTKAGYAATSLGFQSAIPLKRGDALTRDFELGPAARITGRILDRDTGEPVAGISVMALREFQPDHVSRYDSSPTGADGSFSITEMDAGEYRVEFDPPRISKLLPGDPGPATLAYATTWFPGVPSVEMFTPLTLAAGESRVVDVRMQKRPLHHISGVVEFPEGMEAQEIQVQLTERAGRVLDLNGDFPRGGKFHVDGLEGGAYVVHASTSAKKASDRYYASRTIELADHDVDDVKLVLRPGVALHTVFIMAEENVAVPKPVFLIPGPLDPWSGEAGNIGPTEWGLPPGEYFPMMMGAGMRGHAVASVLYGGRPVTGPVDLEGPDSTITIVLTSKPGRIAGTLRTPDQHPAPDATIVLLQQAFVDLLMNADLTTRAGRTRMLMILANRRGELTATPDASGAFRFDDLAPGRYQAVVLTGIDRDRFLDAVFLRDAIRSASLVTVEAERTTNLDLTPR